MRVPNLSVSTNVTETISKLNQQRITLDQQISSGQRISLPEDDGMTMGRVIDIETQKSARLPSTRETLPTLLNFLIPVT